VLLVYKRVLSPLTNRTNKLRTKRTTKTASITHAIFAENPAMPVNPKNAAPMASRKKSTATPNIITLL
jgi:hypothetical protein